MIEQQDVEAVSSYLRGQFLRAFQGESDLARGYLKEAFARHRIAAHNAAIDAALRVLAGAQYSPAPYTDARAGVAALKIKGEG